MRFRVPLKSEIHAINEIVLAAKGYWGYTDEQMAIWRDSLIISEGSLAICPTILAEIDGNVVAVAQVSPTSSPWELTSLWVHPHHMRHGIGRRLLTEIVTLARNRDQTEIAIDSDPNAAAFYLACGAKVVGNIAAPIAGNENRTRPQLRLSTTAV